MFDFGDDRLSARFWAKVQLDETGCWVWVAHYTHNGYGQLRFGGRQARAHRVAYQMLAGPIPAGFQIDHLCRVRRCVNPAHLGLVTQQENIRRGNVGRNERERVHCPAGHPYDAENTFVKRNGWRRCRACHLEHNRASRARRKARPA